MKKIKETENSAFISQGILIFSHAPNKDLVINAPRRMSAQVKIRQLYTAHSKSVPFF